MKHLKVYLLCTFSLIYQSKQSDVRGFDDTVLFDIDFPGELISDANKDHSESILVTTSMKEKYRCHLPDMVEKEETTVEAYSGPSPLELIAPLFNQGICSYRVESYWTYQVCHGKYVKQYHDDRNAKKGKLQEYVLGKWDETQLEHLLEQARNDRDDLKEDTVVPTMKVESMTLPYFEITMGNGTACDLNDNKPRTTRLIYVCFIHGNHVINLLKEASTCSYEVVILTPLLCAHPKYKPKETGNLKIYCLASSNARDEPYSLTKLRRDSNKLKKNAESGRIKVELIQFKAEDAVAGDPQSPKFISDNIVDTNPVKLFLQGKQCLNGGSGWWQFEFCYGKSVEQFHIERDGTRTSINLGVFNKQKHLEWIKEHPHKRPKPLSHRRQLSHFYSEGEACDKTGQPRETEVRLKCSENTSKVTSVSLYLLEPKPCEYILGVEAPLICEILGKADENGLVSVPSEFDDDYGEDTEYSTFPI